MTIRMKLVNALLACDRGVFMSLMASWVLCSSCSARTCFPTLCCSTGAPTGKRRPCCMQRLSAVALAEPGRSSASAGDSIWLFAPGNLEEPRLCD